MKIILKIKQKKAIKMKIKIVFNKIIIRKQIKIVKKNPKLINN